MKFRASKLLAQRLGNCIYDYSIEFHRQTMLTNVCEATLWWKGAQSVRLNLLRAIHSSGTSKQELLKWYRVLKIPVDSDMEEIRAAFLALAKKYHPDSGSPESDAEKFQELESAYRSLCSKISEEKKNPNSSSIHNQESEVEDHDINHTAPQHRQYLSYGGYGSGTPMQRQKQFEKQRAINAADNVLSHRINKMSLNCSHNREEALAVKDKVEARKIKTRFGMDRLVEDLIQESMAKGDFDNLSGRGKPLKNGVANPYVDFTTHKLNEVLIDNGFIPEWILLQKEIREECEQLRNSLIEKRKSLGSLPLSSHDQHQWQIVLESLLPSVKQINSKINKFNLLVPILNKQMLQVHLEKEAKRVLLEVKGENLKTSVRNSGSFNENNTFDFLKIIFGSK